MHVNADGVVASDPQGRTARLPASFATELGNAFDQAQAGQPEGAMTAGVLAAVAEARVARPQGLRQAAPSWRTNTDGERVPLGRTSARSRPLADVLATRRSQRNWMPPRLHDVATVVVRCARVLAWSVDPDGYVTTHRPVPSAGARHPLELYLLAADVEDLPQGTWHFDALSCDLARTALPHEPALARFGEVLGTESPPAALVAVAHLQRTLTRYPSGLSLLWRDAGGLLTTLQLCATDLGLASCIAGTCGVFADNLADGVVDVGALLLGASELA